jgi:hypothetical protein
VKCCYRIAINNTPVLVGMEDMGDALFVENTGMRNGDEGALDSMDDVDNDGDLGGDGDVHHTSHHSQMIPVHSNAS